MSLNRELVEFYIQYKLSQRDCPLQHLGLGDRSTQSDTEHLGLGDRGVDRARLQRETEVDSTELRLDSASDSAPVHSPAPLLDLDAVKEALRDSANEFELRFSRAFSDLHRQLHITPATAYQSFESVMDEVFRDGVNWGRVVGLFAFGGALAVECVDKEMSTLVARIVTWMTVYLDEHIQDWIDSQGGWARFAEIYGQDAAAQSRHSEERFKKWLFAGMTLVTGVVVGSLLAQRRL
uniref:Bcl-2 Bcl-2 homology region 1-3 domain-containing protein n=1 Tax=Periophthalmus magnuspinnatus TaxID=409849 RepID=A0A3B3ZMX9_9GOBI